MTCYHFQKKLNWKIHIFTVKFDSLHRLGSYNERNSHWHLTASSRKTTLLKHLDHQPLHYRYQPRVMPREKKHLQLMGSDAKKSGFFNVSIGWLGFAGGWTPKHQPIQSLVISHEQSSKTHQWHSMILELVNWNPYKWLIIKPSITG